MTISVTQAERDDAMTDPSTMYECDDGKSKSNLEVQKIDKGASERAAAASRMQAPQIALSSVIRRALPLHKRPQLHRHCTIISWRDCRTVIRCDEVRMLKGRLLGKWAERWKVAHHLPMME